MYLKLRMNPAAQAIIAALLFGASAPLSKLLLADISPVMMAGMLYLGSGLAASFIIVIRRGVQTKPAEAKLNRQDMPWMMLAVLCGGIAAPILLMMGLSGTPAASASLLLNFESVATTIIAAVVFKEAIGKRLWTALSLITAGSILLSWHPADAWGFSWQTAAIGGACLLWGLDNNFTRKISARDPLAIVSIKGLGAGVFSFSLSMILNESLPALKMALLPSLWVLFVMESVLLYLFLP
jgi:drug/metabolite transporter (DMT)-like permease